LAAEVLLLLRGRMGAGSTQAPMTIINVYNIVTNVPNTPIIKRTENPTTFSGIVYIPTMPIRRNAKNIRGHISIQEHE